MGELAKKKDRFRKEKEAKADAYRKAHPQKVEPNNPFTMPLAAAKKLLGADPPPPPTNSEGKHSRTLDEAPQMSLKASQRLWRQKEAQQVTRQQESESLPESKKLLAAMSPGQQAAYLKSLTAQQREA